MPRAATSLNIFPNLGLLALGAGISAIFYHIGREPELKTHVPEFIALALGAGVLYMAGLYLVERFQLGVAALIIILGAALAFRLVVLPAGLSISTDAYRYQWDGRVERAGINPYATNPAALHHAFEDPEHPLDVGVTTPTLYPPLSEFSFAWVKTIPDYKRLYTGLDVASIVVILLLLAIREQPLQRVLAYAWNPTVVVSFALCGHHDALAIFTLLVANLFIINQRAALSILFLALSTLSKFFAVLLVPVFLKRTRWIHAVLFAVVVIAGYVPYSGAGRRLLDGLTQYASGWENNDSLFRLLLLAGNSKPQAGLVAAVFLAALILFAIKQRMEPLRASLFVISGLLLLSPNAFSWYFTWSIPFLCFYPNAPWLLMSVTCVLGYAPLIAYTAGGPYRDSPLILVLEYAPVYLCLATKVWREAGQSHQGQAVAVEE